MFKPLIKKFLNLFTNKSEKPDNPLPIPKSDLPLKTIHNEKIKADDIQGTIPILRAEYNLVKFPFFDISHKTSKRHTLEVIETINTPTGKINTIWKVSRGIEQNFPSSFARRLHVEVIERTINELKKPIPRLIKLGSMSDICRKLNITISGKNSRDIKNALRDISLAGIETKRTFCTKETEGKKFFQGVFHLYDSVILIGETLPNGERADSVYVLLNDMYVQNFNSSYTIPLDYLYLQSIKGDVCSRMYECLSLWFFPALENGKDYIQKSYSDLCTYFPLTRQKTKGDARKQLKTAHDQHIANGFLSGVEWSQLPDKIDDWSIKYIVGTRAREWYSHIKTDRQVFEHEKIIHNKRKKEAIEAPDIKPPSRSTAQENIQKENPLIEKLTSLGITKKAAESLVSEYDHETIQDQISALSHRKNIEDRAAFLISSIKEGYPLPKEFKRRKARETEEKEEELRTKYNRYILDMVDAHLKTLDPGQVQKEIVEHKPVYFSKVPAYFQTDLSPEYLDKENERDYRKDKAQELNLPTFDEWKNKV